MNILVIVTFLFLISVFNVIRHKLKGVFLVKRVCLIILFSRYIDVKKKVRANKENDAKLG